MAFNNLEHKPDVREQRWGSAHHLHASIEAMRLAFSDTLQFCADPEVVRVPIDDLLSKQYARRRWAEHFDPEKVGLQQVGRTQCWSHPCAVAVLNTDMPSEHRQARTGSG